MDADKDIKDNAADESGVKAGSDSNVNSGTGESGGSDAGAGDSSGDSLDTLSDILKKFQRKPESGVDGGFGIEGSGLDGSGIGGSGLGSSGSGVGVSGSGIDVAGSGVGIPGSGTGTGVLGAGGAIPGSGAGIAGTGIEGAGAALGGVGAAAGSETVSGAAVGIGELSKGGSGVGVSGSGIDVAGSGVGIPGSGTGTGVLGAGGAIPGSGAGIAGTGIEGVGAALGGVGAAAGSETVSGAAFAAGTSAVGVGIAIGIGELSKGGSGGGGGSKPGPGPEPSPSPEPPTEPPTEEESTAEEESTEEESTAEEESTEEESTDEPTEEPTEEPTDEPTEEPTDEPAVTEVIVTAPMADVSRGSTCTFTATVIGGSDPSLGVRWSITGGTGKSSIDADTGELSVGAEETAGSITVEATSEEDASKSGTAAVTVTGINISVSSSSTSVARGGTCQFTATVVGTGEAVSWSIVGAYNSNTTIDGSGLLTVGAEESLSSLTVKAEAGGESATAEVTVTGINISVSSSSASVARGGTCQFTATVVGTSEAVSWSIVETHNSNTNIDGSGLLTVGAGESRSSLTVRAASSADSSAYAEAMVTVISNTATVSVTPADVTLLVGEEYDFSVRVTDTTPGAQSLSQEVRWEVTGGTDSNTRISDNGVLTVGGDEESGNLRVTAKWSENEELSGSAAVRVVSTPGRSGGDLVVRNVCDRRGLSAKSGNDKSENYGKSVTADNNGYQFYVDIVSGGNPATLVNMVMPMGGPEAGLFRFPRVGERVLVCHAVNDYYFMGFAPDPLSSGFYPEGALKNMTLTDAKDALSEAEKEKGEMSEEEDKTAIQKRIDALKVYIANYVDNGYNPAQINPGNMDDFLDDNGMALRYKKEDNANQPKEGEAAGLQTTKGKGPFSEVGFYNKKSKWPGEIKNYEYYKEGKRLEEERFNRIDVLNIQSTGDIESRAENHHLFMAKRIEILSDMEEISPETRIDNCEGHYTKWESGKAPLGDNPLDDAAVHGGDIHIRAQKNGIFKAAEEIRLQVGRTCLVITDGGLSVATRKVNSNVATLNDTVFDMDARQGITMFGESVNIASARKFSLSDAWGASVGSMVGVLNISGRQITQQTYELAQEAAVVLMNALNLAQNIAAGSLAVQPNKAIEAGKAELAFEWIRWGLDVLGLAYFTVGWKNPNGVYKALNANLQMLDGWIPSAVHSSEDIKAASAALADAEPVEVLMAFLDLVLSITAEVYAVAENAAAIQQRQDLYGSVFDNKHRYWDAQKKSEFKNKLNLCAMCIDSGLIETAMVGNSFGIDIGGPASIRLRQSGDAIIKAGTQKKLYGLLKQDVSVPASIFGEKAAVWVKGGLTGVKIAAGATKLILQAEGKGNKIPVFVEKL
jgi:hypothetical protein